MPYVKSDSQDAFDANVAKFIKEGYSPKQAVAMAYDIKRRYGKKKETK